ncbi:MAG: MopE-related protein [Desulfobacterales bacterium]|jgi:hypothetical protein
MAAQNHTVNSRQFARLILLLGITLVLSVSAGTAYSANLTVAWDANSEPDLIGYRVFCGESSGNYTVNHDVTSSDPNDPPPTVYEFTGLEEGIKYYFAAKAISQTGESAYSQEISYTVPAAPVVSDIDKDGYTATQGDCNDADSSINPGAIDVCGDGIDQDCSGTDFACPDDNSLVRDAQTGVLYGAFEIASDPAASSGAYVYVPNGVGTRFNGPDDTHKIIYTFNLLEEGTYRIKGTVHAANGSDDSFWVKVNGSPAGGYLWDVLQNTSYQQDYVNDRNGADPVEVSLKAGPNTVTVYLREDGTRLDRIELEPVAITAPASDLDGDGFTEAQNDCNDNSASVYPGAEEICGDGIDQDCDGIDLACVDINTDSDGDGLTDFEELNTYFTDPNSADTDRDGFSDGEEIAGGFDPFDPNSNPAFNPSWNSASDFSAVFELGTDNAGVVETNFDVTPLVNQMNGVIGYADSSVGITAYRDMAMLIRMYTNGRFDVRDGWSYDADAEVPYSANSTYHVRMVTDLGAGTYDVWVTPPGGTETQIANDYAFRADAPSTDDLGKVCLIDNNTGEFRVENHTLAQATEEGDLNVAFEIEEVITETRVDASSDDAEENAAGRVGINSSDLDLTYDQRSNQAVGMRFSGTAIPKGATIVNAYIQFQTDETQSVATSLTIQGEDTDNAGAFLKQTGNISSRPRTAAAVSWSPPAWTTVGEAGPNQRTPDIASVIQEIVNRPGWSSDNAIVLIITGTGERVAESYDGDPAAAPLLHVEFTPGG